MYKLIIGNVRVTVTEDNISREQAAEAARNALNTAHQQGKILSYIEVSADDTGLQVSVTEKEGLRSARKTLKQSMLDDICVAVKEKLYPSNVFANKDIWYDGDTGQEWRGAEVDNVRGELVAKFEEWTKNI